MTLPRRFELSRNEALVNLNVHVLSGSGTTDSNGHFVAGGLLLLPPNSLDFAWAARVYESAGGLPIGRGDALFRFDSFRYWSSGPASINGELQFRYLAVFQAYYASQADAEHPDRYGRNLDFTFQLFVPFDSDDRNGKQ